MRITCHNPAFRSLCERKAPLNLRGLKGNDFAEATMTITMNKTPDNSDIDARRKRARRTALWAAAIAVAIYAVFILSGVVSK